jgi:oxalate decarboxylase/phosphoglucose isomerase-like protein (cupin superfamily)
MECGSVQMRLSAFAEYLGSGLAELDETPIFVFDTKSFATGELWQRDYSQLSYFGPDLFDLLKDGNRPDHRWLLVGNPGASSKWHVDPNSTNAWNAVITGAKKWILLPPHLGPPPGVEVSSDGFAVRQPSTLTDWLDAGFYDELVRLHGPSGSNGLVEATCREGEVMFVPRGWWHCVRNVGDEVTIAITQNYAAQSSVTQVRRFLKEMSHCVSGVALNKRAKLWMDFDLALQRERPEFVSGIDIDALIAEAHQEDDVASTGSCCGGEIPEFSFWDHFSTSNKNLSFQR